MSRPISPVRLLAATAFAASVLGLAASAAAQLAERKDLSFTVAHQIAEGAIEECRRRNFAVAVVVVDRGGETMIALRDENASPHTMETARRKAYTARTWKVTSSEFGQRIEKDATWRQAATLPNMIGIPGGVPIKAGNDVIGGVGLSGSPGKD